MQLGTLTSPWMRSQNDIIHIVTLYISKESWDKLPEDTAGTVVSGFPVFLFIILLWIDMSHETFSSTKFLVAGTVVVLCAWDSCCSCLLLT